MKMDLREALLVLVLAVDSILSRVVDHRPYIKQLVDEHNKYRLQDVTKYQANNMQKMEWNDTLARHAESWVRGCNFEHRPNGWNEGENLYYNTARFSNKELITRGLESWYEEIVDFDYNTLHCTPKKMCGHYTQMVWGTTKQVGCSINRCGMLRDDPRTVPNAWYLACFYYPPGNWRGRKPYNKGAACQACDPGQSCDNGLCTDEIVQPSKGNTGGKPATDTTVSETSTGGGLISVMFEPNTTNTTNLKTTGETCTDGSKYCNVLSHLCRKSGFKPKMRKFCSKTCGFCKKADNCRDEISCSFLDTRKNMCTISALKPSLEKNCRKSCGFCKSSASVVPVPHSPTNTNTNTGTSNNACVDIDNRCSTERWQSFCMNQKRRSFMEKNCAKTCGFCLAPTDPQLANWILEIHNDHRRDQRASDMNMMRWNQTLADRASEWISDCTFPVNGRQSIRGLGQNLAFHTKRGGDREMINTILDSWYTENRKHDFVSNDCQRSKSCHYTQMVWSTTTDIGCGFRRCSQLKWHGKPIDHAWYITCFYSPPGNRYNMMTGVFDPPFQTGTPCSQCKPGQNCNIGLCSCKLIISTMKLLSSFSSSLLPIIVTV